MSSSEQNKCISSGTITTIIKRINNNKNHNNVFILRALPKVVKSPFLNVSVVCGALRWSGSELNGFVFGPMDVN